MLVKLTYGHPCYIWCGYSRGWHWWRRRRCRGRRRCWRWEPSWRTTWKNNKGFQFEISKKLDNLRYVTLSEKKSFFYNSITNFLTFLRIIYLVRFGPGQACCCLQFKLAWVPSLLDHRPTAQGIGWASDVLEDRIPLAFDGSCNLFSNKHELKINFFCCVVLKRSTHTWCYK